MILPLANRRDKVTQVKWGIKDFESRFGRRPEGMWLPETAVDTETLEVLAENGIQFTILAPRQAKRVRSEQQHSISMMSPEHGSIRRMRYTARGCRRKSESICFSMMDRSRKPSPLKAC